jgi:uncharacterized protein YoxC
MSAGGIALIICAVSLFAIAVAFAYAVIRFGRLIDEAKVSLKSLTEETVPLIDNVTQTVNLVNGPLESFNKITKNVENISTKASEATSNFVDKGGPALKIAGALMSAAGASKKRKAKKTKAE